MENLLFSIDIENLAGTCEHNLNVSHALLLSRGLVSLAFVNDFLELFFNCITLVLFSFIVRLVNSLSLHCSYTNYEITLMLVFLLF